MTKSSEVLQSRYVFRGVNCAEILEKARRRIAGIQIPVTRHDEEQTATTIYAISYDFDRQMRLELLSAVIAGLISGIRSTQERAKVLDCTFGVIRDYLSNSAKEKTKCRPAKKNAGVILSQEEYYGTIIDLSDLEAPDLAFDRALRRRAGECLQVTPEDVNGTSVLLRQLMTEVELVVLVCVTAQAIVEEYNGKPPNEALQELEVWIRALVDCMDRMPTGDGLMN